MVLDALQVQELDACTLLETRCCFPELNGLERQYDSIKQMVIDGDTLGCHMGKMTREDMELFAAALEYEDCRSLRFALDIIQNLQCYDYIPSKSLKSFAEKHLREEDVPEELIQSGCIGLEGYAGELLETAGYTQVSGDIGYLRRNDQRFEYKYSTPEDQPHKGGMEMV
ncbi:hypothetical protein D1646_03850 [Pseudoflavonifractor sp. 60]|nr:hypothetical protein [Pseudoflavonifractor sp. 60]